MVTLRPNGRRWRVGPKRFLPNQSTSGHFATKSIRALHALPELNATELLAGMSALGPKQTWPRAVHMSAFRGKADMTICACLLLRSLLGVKRTCRFALRTSANDPKRTLAGPSKDLILAAT